MSDMEPNPAAQFCNHQYWNEAMWIGTSFKTDPKDEAPPVLCIQFANYGLGVKLFRTWVSKRGNVDGESHIRVSIIEGEIEGQDPGYTIRISARDLTGGPGQWQRMHPIPGLPDLLEPFKAAYLQHGEFLLAPIVLHDDDQAYVNASAGIIKTELELRWSTDIGAGDIDHVLLETPSSAPVPRLPED